jgi:transcriptional regulator with XRE-family HTH domain
MRAVRELRKLSQKSIAATVGVSQSLVALWENGKCSPTPARWRSLSKAYGIPLDEFTSEFVPGEDA